MRKYFKMIGGYSLGPILGALISFITIPLITLYISPDEFGRVSMFTLATTLVEMVIYFGLDQAYVKYYYEINKRDVFFNSLIPSFALSFLLGALILFMNKPISLWLFDNEDEFGLVVMLALYLPFSVLGRFHATYARVSEHAIRYSLFTILSKVALLVCCIVFFYITGRQFRSVVYATTFSHAITSIVMVLINSREIDYKGFRPSRDIISKLFRYGLPLIPATIVGWVLNSTDQVMIRSLVGYEQLGLYSAALKIVSALGIIQSCFVTFWTPIAFRWKSEGASIRRFELVGQILCLVMSLLLVLILLFKDVLIAILSPEYRSAVSIIPFLLLHPIMYTISEVTVVGLYFTGRSSKTILVAIISFVINIAGNVLLIPTYGAVGASIATGISYCVFFWTRTLVSRNVWAKFRIDTYMLYTVMLILLCAVNVSIQGAAIYLINAVAFIVILMLNIPLILNVIRKGNLSK